jgi:ribosomal protein S27AE
MQLTEEYEQFLGNKILKNATCPFCDESLDELPDTEVMAEDEIMLSDNCPACGAKWILQARIIKAENFVCGGSNGTAFENQGLGAAAQPCS